MNSRPDVNCDMGEGMLNDAQIMPYISSANIACGFHAGNKALMKQTVLLAKANGVKIGAHPSFNDKVNFGRKEHHLTQAELYNLMQTQLLIINKIATENDAALNHVKPHGALYNMAAKDFTTATVIAQAVKDFNPNLVLYGLSGSFSIQAAKAMQLKTASEVFADRRYSSNGLLMPRSNSKALLNTKAEVEEQVMQLIKYREVIAENGKAIPLHFDTICIHGDGELALEVAKAIEKCIFPL